MPDNQMLYPVPQQSVQMLVPDESKKYTDVANALEGVLKNKLQQEAYEYNQWKKQLEAKEYRQEQERFEYAYGELAKIWGADKIKGFHDMGAAPTGAETILKTEFYRNWLNQNRERLNEVSRDELREIEPKLTNDAYTAISTAIDARDAQELQLQTDRAAVSVDKWLYSALPTNHSEFVDTLHMAGLDPTKYEPYWDEYKMWAKNQGYAWAGAKEDGGGDDGGTDGGGGYTYDKGSLALMMRRAGISLPAGYFDDAILGDKFLNEAQENAKQAYAKYLESRSKIHQSLAKYKVGGFVESGDDVIVAGVYKVTPGTANTPKRLYTGDKWKDIDKDSPEYAGLKHLRDNWDSVYIPYLGDKTEFIKRANEMKIIMDKAHERAQSDTKIKKAYGG